MCRERNPQLHEWTIDQLVRHWDLHHSFVYVLWFNSRFNQQTGEKKDSHIFVIRDDGLNWIQNGWSGDRCHLVKRALRSKIRIFFLPSSVFVVAVNFSKEKLIQKTISTLSPHTPFISSSFGHIPDPDSSTVRALCAFVECEQKCVISSNAAYDMPLETEQSSSSLRTCGMHCVCVCVWVCFHLFASSS